MAIPTVLSLASGGGGLDAGVALALGGRARTVCFVENEVSAAAALVAGMEAQLLDEAPIWSDLKSFDGRPWRGLVDGIIGGYPCQPFSVAGRRLGADDPRHLWPYIADIIRAVEPRWCFFENVGGHLRLGFREVAEELRGMGYRVAATLWRAEEVGAPHRRERLFIMAHRNESGRGLERSAGVQLTGAPLRNDPYGRNTPVARANALDDDGGGHGRARRWVELTDERGAVGDTDVTRKDAFTAPRGPRRAVGEPGRPLGDADITGLEGRHRAIGGGAYELPAWPPGPTSDAWGSIPPELWPATPQPAVRGVADGGKSLARTDWLRILGNGCVPEQVAAAFRELWGVIS